VRAPHLSKSFRFERPTRSQVPLRAKTIFKPLPQYKHIFSCNQQHISNTQHVKSTEQAYELENSKNPSFPYLENASK